MQATPFGDTAITVQWAANSLSTWVPSISQSRFFRMTMTMVKYSSPETSALEIKRLPSVPPFAGGRLKLLRSQPVRAESSALAVRAKLRRTRNLSDKQGSRFRAYSGPIINMTT